MILKEMLKKLLILKHGTESCEHLARIPSNELYFRVLRENIEKEYSKYQDDLNEERYNEFIEEIFELYKRYKLNLDKSVKREYGKIYADSSEELVNLLHKYNLKCRKCTMIL